MSNNIIVVSGPSGSGKSTLISMLLKEHPDIVFSISHTTRATRGKEVDGVEYHFVTTDTFEEMIEQGAFVEWARVYDNYYGTSFREVEEKSSGTKVLILDIDVQGARLMREQYPDALYILIAPPSIKELEKRILQREQEITPAFRERIRIAREELKEYNIYDYTIINEELRKAYGVLNSIYTAYKNTTPRNETRLKLIIESY